MSSPVTFFTGATGLVGGELLQHFLHTTPDRKVIILARNPLRIASPDRNGRLTVVEGDLTKPNLGLRYGALRRIKKEVTEIIHCAAQTRFGLPIEEARATNTYGTLNVFNIARTCKRLEKVAHCSTVYVAGRRTGRIPEAPLENLNGFVNTYQQSKFEAEQLVLQAMSEVPTVVYRLSTIIGESLTGRVRQYNYFHQLLRLFARNVLPLVPGDLSWQIDLIPTEWSIAALGFLFEKQFVPGDVLNVCAGAGNSPRMQEVKDTSQELFEKHPLIQKWLPITEPKFVSLPEYEEYVGKSLQGDDKLLIKILGLLNKFLPQMGINQTFENDLLRARLEGSGLVMPVFGSYFNKVISYCLDTDWGRAGGDSLPGER
jgi:nucleoside-diphosphate-sugar epimerase